MSRPPNRQRKPGDRHARVGPGIDVGACNARGDGVLFAQANRFITCEECKAKRYETKTSTWQLARLRKIAKNKKAAALSSYAPRMPG